MQILSQRLTLALAPYHLLKHPFYQAWMEGRLSVEQLQKYAVQYYPHVAAFPRYVSAVHSLCEDELSRTDLARNIAEEDGIVGGVAHPELWLRFAEGLGVDRQAVLAARPTVASQAVVDTFFKAARASYAEGLASVYAYEYQIPMIAHSKVEGLKQNYGIQDSRTLEFFEVHEKADEFHSQACREALDRLPDSVAMGAETAAVASAQALWGFLTEAYE